MEVDRNKQLASAGIVGAGGAGFPTHVKLNAKADTVIINGAECEPLLRVDQQLMERYPTELLEALELIMEQVGAAKGVVGLKEHYHEAVAALERELPRHPNIRLCRLGSFYPAGDEQVLVYEATGRIVPEGGIPLHCGAVVTNVETALNVYEAVKNDRPVTHSYVTITGAVRQPKTLLLPLGLSVREAIELAGGPTVEAFAVINGGPMMGKLVMADSPITKTTKGLIVLPQDHSLLASLTRPLDRSIREAGAICMQCSQCSVTCPRGLLGHRLEPHKLMRLAAYGSTCDKAVGAVHALLCTGCRLCEYSCVMGLQPWKLNNFLKAELRGKVKSPPNAKPEQADPFRAYKRYPVSKLVRRLDLSAYDRPAPMEELSVQPQQVELLLSQGVGAPSVPVVKAGDTVTQGMLIAKVADDKLGSCLHASMDGVVASVTDRSIVLKHQK